jgi:two-component sensor histidine kinase
VGTLALIHEKLYQAKDLARVDFREYLDDLTRAIAVSHARDDCPVTVHQSVEVSRLPIPTVIPVALVVSELLTNTYKHAFTGCSYGNVWIEFGHDDGLFRLRITDDGVGLPEDAATQGMEGLGMELVSTLAEQLGGDLSIGGGRHGGARFVLEFPESADSGDPAH